VYAAAATEQDRSERRRTAQRLARHGITVVDAPPAEIAVALADAYLALKGGPPPLTDATAEVYPPSSESTTATQKARSRDQ
jgi:hypothetical protein